MDALSQLLRLVGEPAIPFGADSGATELVAMMAALHGHGTPNLRLRAAFDERERQVCRAVRNGRLKLDYRPPANGTVTLPAMDHALYAQSLIHWAAHLGQPIMRIAEACRRAGDGATPEDVKAAVRKIEFEDSTMRTDRLYLTDFGTL
ncbi:MAG: hypothetical protein KA795_01930 [Burkholderiaceae bacterium]|nr:hypothetical protein [Burkholderiaceae bacterium]